MQPKRTKVGNASLPEKENEPHQILLTINLKGINYVKKGCCQRCDDPSNYTNMDLIMSNPIVLMQNENVDHTSIHGIILVIKQTFFCLFHISFNYQVEPRNKNMK